MKKSRLFLYIVIIGVIVGIMWFDKNNKPIDFIEPIPKEVEEPLKIDIEDIYKGELLLVNEEHGIKKSAKSDIVNLFENKHLIGDYGLVDHKIKLSKEITTYFNEMIEAAKKDGVDNFLISSGYREFQEQTKLYQEMGKNYALPAGYSEHQLGLALDVGSSAGTMAEAEEGVWVAENAWRFGFVLRYPEEKKAITGIEYEPWHIRYVSKPHSAIMYDKDFVLEEYLDFLRDKKRISTTVDGKNYHVRYYPVSKSMTVNIPKDSKYTISGDNVGGVIVTVYH
ncbi:MULTISPECIES: M15 family metallopeptidase [Clostridia]|uniref:M15 family metallopeptidase n=1 Tax=Clostridia TaxID=186801 RepID=UPI000EA15222|nr:MULTISPECIES: M15 family metallopeptidase [Clostridia]NBJ68012.1 D-alanyl-D-alanine carboxypeptidase family protein [Roseburia sp. 1XD42-34]RKI82455.1 D-alanyl-D-alanine carboxypeptidase family protein [Clostridium sp. 1xD42-85]